LRGLLATFLFAFNTGAQGFHQRCFGRVVLRELHIEFEFHHDSISLILHDVGEADKILVHNKRLLGLIRRHRVKSLEDLGHQDVKDLIDLQQVQEEKMDHVREEARTLAEALMLENCKDLGKHGIKVFIGL
jgi:hypothetical protein